MTPYIQEVNWRMWMCCLMSLLTLAVVNANGQSIKRQSIGVCGTNLLAEGIMIKQTVGQPYTTTAFYGAGVSFMPGFQQPNTSQAPMQKNSAHAFHTISVYPNPATHTVKISSGETIRNGMLKVYDSKGRLMLSEKVTELNNHSLNCESWKSGFYIISIVGEQNQKYSSKLLITK